MNSNITNLGKMVRQLYKLYKTSNNIVIFNRYEDLKTIYANIIKQARRSHYEELVNESHNKTKTAWSIIKNECGTNKSFIYTSYFISDLGKKLSDIKKVGDFFNIFCTKYVSNLVNNGDIQINKNNKINIQNTIYLRPVTQSELLEIIYL